jgi:hypothetical protein
MEVERKRAMSVRQGKESSAPEPEELVKEVFLPRKAAVYLQLRCLFRLS